MASKAPRVSPYRPRRDRTWKRRRDRRSTQPAPTLAALLTVIPSLTRPELGRMVQRMIDRMDVMDGDPDFEDGNDLEDDFHLSDYARQYGGGGAGCEISEPDAFSYSEWHTRDWRTRQRGGPEMVSTASIWDHEDSEDDDPLEQDDDSGQCDEDGVNTAVSFVGYTVGGSGPGCPISDPDGGNDFHLAAPSYGPDQTEAPANYRDAERKRLRAQYA
ncbi:hypothetical protein BV96_01791 [Sphingomonas paucimobilis]|nr:hypothetical protein BV96_01791 [Sphingomonas paucimobilis]